jgi:uncharacterized membrane protein YgdD (TMEM256/DUF423 family)
MFNKTTLLTLASFLMLSGVAAGAFGAHGLQGKLSDRYLNIYEKAVFYQLIHGLGILIITALAVSDRFGSNILLLWSGFLMSLGTVIFSGSLYLLVLTNTPWLGAITPVGGMLLIIAWSALLLFSRRFY